MGQTQIEKAEVRLLDDGGITFLSYGSAHQYRIGFSA